MSSFTKDTIIAFCTRIVTSFLLMIYGVILARTLGPSGSGVVSICGTILSMSVLILSFDIGIGNVYFTGSQKYSVQSLIGNSFFLSIIIGAIISVLLILFVPLLSHKFLNDEYHSVIYLVAMFPTLAVLSSSLTNILLGLRKIIQLSVVQIFSRTLSIILIILFLFAFKLNVFGAVFIIGIVSLMSIFILIFWLKKDGYHVSFKPRFSAISDLFKYSVKNYFGSVFQSLNYRLDMFLVAYFLGSADVGLYTVAVSMAELIWHIPDSVGYIIFPKISASNTEEANRFTPIVARNTLFITFFIALIVFPIAGWIISLLFGKAFIGSVLPFRLLLPGIVALGIWKVICNDLAGRGLPQYKSYSAGISLVITVLLDVILIPRFGIAGAALASSVAYIIASVFAVFCFMKVAKARITDILVPVFNDIQYLRILLDVAKNKRQSVKIF